MNIAFFLRLFLAGLGCSKFAFLVWITIMFTACYANRALPKETALFPDAKTEKWWIINTISKDDNGQDVHLCTLIRFTPADGKYFTHFFTSLWMASDSTYYAGRQSSEGPFHPKREKFPIKLGVSAQDSALLPWSWKLSRKRLRLQSAVQSKAGKELLRLNMKIKLNNDSSFHVVETRGETTIQHLSPEVFDLDLSGAWNITSPAVLNFHVIGAGERLLEKTKRSFIAFLDVSLNQEEHFSLLYETDRQGNVHLLSQTCWQGRQVSPATTLLLSTDKQKTWKSPRSNMSYPLNIFIEIPERSVAFLIKPRLEEQEISVHKSAFWMGAVQATHSVTGAILGNGNLYILKQ